MIYLDNSATTRVLPAAVSAATSCFEENYFNPSSAYGAAVEVERQINAARERLGWCMGVGANEVIYTSGGTESNNMAIFGTQSNRRGRGRMITTMIEHPSVYEVFRKFEAEGRGVCYIGVDKTGAPCLNTLQTILTQDTAFVSMMHVNNETGAISDIASAYAIIKRIAPKALLHVDGVQAFCKLPFTKPCWDMYSISAHKFHGPKGIGALFVREGVPFSGGLIGGGQERGLRSGTTNTPGIMGMDAALYAYQGQQGEWVESMRACKMRLAKNILDISDVTINGPSPEYGAPHIMNASFAGVRGEVLLHALSEQGVMVSTGSACSAKKKGKNRILAAMGLNEARQESAIRFSLSPFNTLEEMDQAAQIIAEQVAVLRKYQRR